MIRCRCMGPHPEYDVDEPCMVCKDPEFFGRKTAATKIPDGVTIDRPKGYRKTFGTPSGPKKVTYPVDYGFFTGITNPDDDEEADVFVGTGDLYGRFMKGDNLSGKWQPDERKWYWGLTQEELDAVKAMYDHPKSNLLRDWLTFDSPEALKEDLPRAKTASLPEHLQELIAGT